VEEAQDKKQALEQLTLRWESDRGNIVLALTILEQLRSFAPANEFIHTLSDHFIKQDSIPSQLLYELFSWHYDRQNHKFLKLLSSHWQKIILNKEEDYYYYLQYLRDTNETQKAFEVLQEAKQNDFVSDRLFLIHLELLIDGRHFEEALQLLSVQKCKEMKDPESYLIRAKLLFHEPKITSSIRDEVEYLCLEALRLDAQKIDAFHLLLELYTLVFKAPTKIMFLFKLAQSYHIQDSFLMKEILSALLIINEVGEAQPLYEKLESILPFNELPVLSFVQMLHLQLNHIGLAKNIWGAFLKRASNDNPSFYKDLIEICDNLLQQTYLWKAVDYDLDEVSEWSKALTMDTKGSEEKIHSMLRYSFDRLMELDPDKPENYYLKGLALLEKDPRNASLLFLKAIELCPDYILAHFELAGMYFASHQYLKAFDSYSQVLMATYTDVDLFMESYMQLSEISIKFGWIEEAERYLELARQMSPKDYRVHLSLGKIYLKEAKIVGSEVALDKAEDHLNEVVLLYGNHNEALYYLGQVSYAKRQFLPAIKYYSQAVLGGLYNEKGETFASEENCYLWISRSYYQLYKDMLFSSREYLMEAITYAKRISLSNSPRLMLEYIHELYETADMQAEVSVLAEKIRELETHQLSKTWHDTEARVGVVKILTVFSPLSDESQAEEKAIFSKGHIGEIQTVVVNGNGNIHITGNISDSFKNSVHTAFGFIKQVLDQKGMQDLLKQKDLIVDLPGWYPRYDGSSAGSSLAIAMLSACLKKALPQDITITGEITLLGDILPVAGIKEKIEATFEKNIQRVFIPKENRWDYLDMVLKGVSTELMPDVSPVSSVMEIVDQLFDFTDKA
jgi:tetratricopeptide (TPR) repeat protein